MGKIIDLTGNRYGALVVQARAPKPVGSKSSSAFWECLCDCGNTKIVSGNVLKQGKSRSCGCLTSKLRSESHSEDLTGQKFGLLTVVSRAKRPEGLTSTGAYWLCHCECGNSKVIMGKSLRTGKTVSCGCHTQMISDITGNTYGKLTVIGRDKPRSKEGNGTYWNCQCECGNIISVQKSNLTSGNVKSCGCLISVGEHLIEEILQKEEIIYSKQFSFSDLTGQNGGLLRFDFAIFDNDERKRPVALIEFQGEQHYDTQKSQFFDTSVIQNDKKKKEYCLEHNIPLFCIPYWIRNNLNIEKIFSDKYRVRRQ